MFFGCKACGILAPRPGNEPAPSALEGKVLTNGPPGKSPNTIFNGNNYCLCCIFAVEILCGLLITWVFTSLCGGESRRNMTDSSVPLGVAAHVSAGNAGFICRCVRAWHSPCTDWGQRKVNLPLGQSFQNSPACFGIRCKPPGWGFPGGTSSKEPAS